VKFVDTDQELASRDRATDQVLAFDAAPIAYHAVPVHATSAPPAVVNTLVGAALLVQVVPSGDVQKVFDETASQISPFHSSATTGVVTAPTFDHVYPSVDRARFVDASREIPPASQEDPFQRMRYGVTTDALDAQISPPAYHVLASKEYA
jgi:hypothetical protein